MGGLPVFGNLYIQRHLDEKDSDIPNTGGYRKDVLAESTCASLVCRMFCG